MGTPDFAVPTLAACLEAGHDVAMVYCQPPRPAGRGMALTPSPVQRFAEERGLAIRAPVSLKGPEEQAAFAALGLDLAVVVAYGLILPRAILTAPRLGCVNVHASRLPRWRGAAPIHRAIEAGDDETGITIMAMDEGLDTGPTLLTSTIAIEPRATTGALHDTLKVLGARLLARALAALEEGSLTPTPQPAIGATYAAKVSKEEARIDWRLPAARIDAKIRAFDPFPGAWTEIGGQRVKIRAAIPIARADGARAEPGTVLDGDLTIACGDGALKLLTVQREGKAAQDATTFLRGFPVPAGARLG